MAEAPEEAKKEVQSPVPKDAWPFALNHMPSLILTGDMEIPEEQKTYNLAEIVSCAVTKHLGCQAYVLFSDPPSTPCKDCDVVTIVIPRKQPPKDQEQQLPKNEDLLNSSESQSSCASSKDNPQASP